VIYIIEIQKTIIKIKDAFFTPDGLKNLSGDQLFKPANSQIAEIIIQIKNGTKQTIYFLEVNNPALKPITAKKPAYKKLIKQ
jgi:hypothetical protein